MASSVVVQLALHPAFTPAALPADLSLLPLPRYKKMFAAAGVHEVEQADGATAWQLSQVFAVDGDRREHFARIELENANHAHLTAASCVKLAQTLLEYATALANVNDEPATAHAMLELLQQFASPQTFERFKAQLVSAAERELVGRIDAKP